MECGGPAPLWPEPAWRGFIEKHSTMMGQLGQSDQSAARPAHSKELTLPLDQRFLKFCATGHVCDNDDLARVDLQIRLPNFAVN
jgi:hypothetical protein